MNRQYKTNQTASKQAGVALITSLFLLLLMVIIGLAGMRTTTLEERMSANLRSKNVALQAAEISLVNAELTIESLVHLDDFKANGASGYYSTIGTTVSPWETIDWSDQSIVITGSAIPGTASNPVYMIEHFSEVLGSEDKFNLGNYGQDAGSGDGHQIFRITALGTGASSNAKAMVQSIYGKRF